MSDTKQIEPKLEYQEIASVEFHREGYEVPSGFLTLGEDCLCEVRVLNRDLFLTMIDKYNGEFTTRIPDQN